MKSYNAQYQYKLWYKQQKNITNDALFIKNAYLCVVCLIIYQRHFYAMNSYLNITNTLHRTRTCAISTDRGGGYFVDIQIVRQCPTVIFPSRRCIDRLIGRSCACTCRSVGYSISSMSNLLTRMCNTLRIYLSQRRLSYHNMGQSYTTRTL